MDQTTETADLTETEKYLNNTISCSTNTIVDYSSDCSDIDDDDEDSAHDALLGGIRTGLKTMTKTAKSALSTCKSKTELDDAIGKIQASSLRLLKLEKSFLKTASIVAEVVDDLVSDFEENEDDDDKPECLCGERVTTEREEQRETKKEEIKHGSGDAKVEKSKQQPYVFRPSKSNLVSLERFKDKLKAEYHKRMDEYKNSLTDDFLKEDRKFENLLKQIRMGKDEAEIAMSKEGKAENTKEEKGNATLGQNETIPETKGFSIMSSSVHIPFTKEDLQNYTYKPYDEDEDMDHSVLPSVDPISKQLISFPVKNKFCNHVFDRASIYGYIAGNPNATCPVHMCRNKRKLENHDFVSDPILTAHVRQKNNLE